VRGLNSCWRCKRERGGKGVLPKYSSRANVAELANHLIRGVAGLSGAPDAARSAAVGFLKESLSLREEE
jgi:hypothetical protein